MALTNKTPARTVQLDEPMAMADCAPESVQDSLERLAQRIGNCIGCNADVLQQPYPDRKDDADMGVLLRCEQLHVLLDVLQEQTLAIRARVGRL